MEHSSALYNRLVKNLSRLKGYLKQNNIEAFRLYDKDIPEYPYIVDIYGKYGIAYEKGNREFENSLLSEAHQKDLHDVLVKLGFQTENLILKTRKVQSGTDQYEKINQKGHFFTINEGKFKFYVNLEDYLDTGLFLDHRPMRSRIFKEAKDKTFLNLFAYTGSVSVSAALGGARTTTVDMSNTYLDWAYDNFKLNEINPDHHYFIRENALEFIKEHDKTYDLIFLDPPTFSNSKKMEGTFDVFRDQYFLISTTAKLLKPGGILYFSTNHRKFRMEQRIVDEFNVKDISRDTIPMDFKDEKIHQCYKITQKVPVDLS